MGFFRRKITAVKEHKEETKKENTMKKDNNICELVFILDRSGSMAGLENDTVGGFNSLIEKQKKEDGTCYVTTVLFDNMYEILHDRCELSEIPEMTTRDYYVRGSTALLDAVGQTVEHIMNIHKYQKKEDVPSKTLFVITTDGMENASLHYTSKTVKELIKSRKKEGWEFLFLGANMDAVEAASNIGIDRNRAVRYNCDSVGTKKNFDAVSYAASAMRTGASFGGEWKDDIEEDFKKRGRK